MREKDHIVKIDNLTCALREQRKVITIAQNKDDTLLKRYSLKNPLSRTLPVDTNADRNTKIIL